MQATTPLYKVHNFTVTPLFISHKVKIRGLTDTVTPLYDTGTTNNDAIV